MALTENDLLAAGTPSTTGCPVYNWGPIDAYAKVFAIGY
jgi:hypothetical protein